MPRSTTARTLREFHDALLAAYGPRHWWPGETRTEIMVGAVLTQNTNWTNVERAIANLKSADALDWHRLNDMGHDELAALIRPAGYFNVKARRLKKLVEWVVGEFDGDLDAMFARSTATLREELLNVNGIGRETADSILLYAGGHVTFVVDAYTARVLRRHGLIDEDADYELIKELFEGNLPEDEKLYNEYHALLVEVGKQCCRPRNARCEECPLGAFPHDTSR
ncbi:MAG: endonuclease III domain-containing protein [Phycisphaerae bacterium]|nr:endonuclease III domain-containing protein [Phycisphaerae bacterium]